MPNGPVFMSPESMIDSFKTELILKKSEVYFKSLYVKSYMQYLKIAWISDIKKIFPVTRNPLFAGFGNREKVINSISLLLKLIGYPCI